MEHRTGQFKPDGILIILLTLLSTAERIQVAGIPVYAILFIPFLYRGFVYSIRNNRGKLLCDRFELTILIWVLSGIVLSIIFGTGGDYRGLESLIINALIIFCIYTYSKDNFDLNFLIGVMCGLILNLVIGVMEIHIDGFHVVSNFTDYYIRLFRNKAVGFQVNANDYCAMLIVYTVGLLYLMDKLKIQSKLAKMLIYVLLIASVYVAIRDFSRAAIICLIIIAAYLIVYKIFGKHRWQMVSVFLLIIGLFALYLTNGIETRFAAFVDVNSDTIRLKTYADTWEFIKSHYFLGVGAGNTTRLMGVSPHNLIFELLSDYGIISAGLLSISFLRLLSYRTDKDDGNGYYLIMLFGICFLLSGFSVSSLLRNRMCWVFFAFFSRQLKETELNRETYNQGLSPQSNYI